MILHLQPGWLITMILHLQPTLINYGTTSTALINYDTTSKDQPVDVP